MTAEQAPAYHKELVSTTAKLALRILANPVAKPPEKAALTRVLLESMGCNPGEVKLAMEAEVKAKVVDKVVSGQNIHFTPRNFVRK